MNTETKLYPFRLEEAKLNKGNVVTRDGKKATYHDTTGHYPFPLQIVINSEVYCFTNKGTFWGEGTSTLDLFMTTPPEDKPAQAKPAEEDRIYPCEKCGAMRTKAEGGTVFTVCDDCWDVGKKPTEQPTDLHSRLATAEKLADEQAKQIQRLTRERDDYRNNFRAQQSRAESAEAQLATLRGELAEVKTQLLSARENLRVMEGAEGSLKAQLAGAKSRIAELEQEYERSTNLAIRETNERNRLQKQLAAHTWIPVSERMPTEADGNHQGSVLVHGTSYQLFCHWQLVDPGQHTHWLSIPPLPTPPEESEARKEFEDKFAGRDFRFSSDGEYFDTDTQLVWIGWQAAREGGGNHE